MDDDDFRRGRPSCHKQFGEANALLAGDGLLTHAFYLASVSPIISEYKIKAIEVLSKYSGVHGMIGGQVIDLLNENKPCELNVILKTYELKTAGLLIASSMMGCILAGANEEKIQAAYDFAYNLGIAFQIQDDLLDYFGDEKKLGKPVGSDQKNDKHTYVSLVGIENAKNDVVTYSNKAIKALEVFGEKSKELIELTNYLITREF
jgi:geranylgeranyl diphosphate synthase type II